MARATRPMAIAGQLGTMIAIVGAHWAGVEWVVAAVPITLLLAFLLAAAVVDEGVGDGVDRGHAAGAVLDRRRRSRRWCCCAT